MLCDDGGDYVLTQSPFRTPSPHKTQEGIAIPDVKLSSGASLS